MNCLLLATRNRGKIREIGEILGDLDIQIKNLLDYSEIPEIIENGKTLEENALKKAHTAFKHTHFPSLADDSSLEVFYLNGQPGVYSARYAGENATYDQNNKKLLLALQNTSPEQRRAQFRCVIAFVAPEVEKTVEGICPGTITHQPQGQGGFGYDPVFIPDGFQQTYAELLSETKNRISHRGLALRAIKNFLSQYYLDIQR